LLLVKGVVYFVQIPSHRSRMVAEMYKIL